MAGDIWAEEIRLVWGKVVKCQEKDCYSLVYDNKENRESVAPLFQKSSDSQTRGLNCIKTNVLLSLQFVSKAQGSGSRSDTIHNNVGE